MILKRFQLISTRSRRVRIHLLLQNHTCTFKETRETHLQQRLVRLRNFSNVSGNSFPDCFSLLHHLGGCESTQDINYGKAVHSICIKTGFHRLPYVQNNIIRFYGNYDDLIKARQLFDEMSEPNLVSWTCMISLYVREAQYDIALCMFSDMCRLGLRPNEFGFSVAIKACRVKGDIVMGELIYGLIMKCGFELDEFCSSSILGLFSELGESKSARKFFDGVPSWRRSEALWNTLLNSYAEGSDAKGVVLLFSQMMHSDTLPSCVTFAIVAKLCATILCLNLTSIFQCQIIKFGFQSHLVVGGALVNAYAKLRLLNSACEVFRNLEEKDNTVWCSIMAGFHLAGDAEGGLNCYLEFLSEGHNPDPFTFATVLSLCSGSETRNFDAQLHCSFFKYGFILDSFLGSAFIDMYGSRGFVSEAYKCFLEVKEKSEVCFGAMIKIFVSSSYNNKAFELFCYMKKLGYMPSLSILCHVLKACSNLSLFEKGRSLHGQIIQFPCAADKLTAENVLIEMYAKCGAVDEAENVFRNIQVPNEFSWTAIMIACNESWQFGRSLQLFYEMFLSPVPVKPSPFAVVTALQACEMLKSLDKGRQLHAYCIKGGLESQSFVGSSLINMYAANKSEIRSVFQAFGSMNEHDIVSWCTMMSVCARNGHETEALSLFAELYNASIFSIDEVILSTCLSACAGLSALEKGKWFHAYILKSGFMLHEHVTSSAIDMYCKSGSIDGARKLFDEIKDHSLVSWTAMISGYAHHGLGHEAIKLFNEMVDAGLDPDEVTFVGLLMACSHAGLVKEGLQYFELIKDYNLDVTLNHYACMVDLLGRAEKINEAKDLIMKSPFRSSSLLWKTLLGACNKHGNVEAGSRVAKMLIETKPDEPSTYVTLSNIYASALMWSNSIGMRNKMKEETVCKKPGHSWVQVAI